MVIDHLVGERLLTVRSDRSDIASTYIEVAHESLVLKWERFRSWLQEDSADRILHEEFSRDFNRWMLGVPGASSPQSEDNLPSPEVAKAYLSWLERRSRPLELTLDQQTFVFQLRGVLRRQEDLINRLTGRQLALQAQLELGAHRPRLDIAALLATEAVRRLPTRENIQILRAAFDPLPRRVAEQQFEGNVLAIASSPQGDLLAISTDNSRLYVYGVEPWRLTSQFEVPDPVRNLNFVSDGKRLVAFAGNSVTVWTVDSNLPINRIDGLDEVTASAVASPSNLLAFASADKLRVYRLEAEKLTEHFRVEHELPINRIAFSPDGRYLAYSDSVKWPIPIYSFGLTSDWCHCRVHVLDTAQGTELFCLDHEGFVIDLAFGLDAQLLATTSYTPKHPLVPDDSDNSLHLWNMGSGELVGCWNHSARVTSVAFLHSRPIVVTASHDATVRLWVLADGTEALRLEHGNKVERVSVSYRDDYLATVDSENCVRIWDPSCGDEVCRVIRSFAPDSFTRQGSSTISRWPHSLASEPVLWRPNSRQFVTSNRDHVTLWESGRGSELIRVRTEAQVNAVAIHPDLSYLLTSSADGTVRVWDIGTGEEVTRFSSGATSI